MTLSEGLSTSVPNVSSGHSSSYYSDLMSQYNTLKSTFCKYSKLNQYADTIANAIVNLQNIKSKTTNARSLYQSGGYVIDNKTLDQNCELGDLNKCSEYLTTAIEKLTLIKQKTIDAANNYETKYNNCVSRLELAKNYYNKALEKEASMQ